MKTTECDIIQDLLPLYADGSLSKASEELVDAHIAGCEECRSALTHMQSEIKIQAPAANISSSINDIKKQVFSSFAVILAGLLAAAVISIAAVSIKYSLPIFRGFSPMGAADLSVSSENGQLVITPKRSDFNNHLYFIYRLNDDGTVSMFLTYGDTKTQYAVASETGKKLEWKWSPYRISAEQAGGSLQIYSNGGPFTEDGVAGGSNDFSWPVKITLQDNISDIYYAPDMDMTQIMKWDSATHANSNALINEIINSSQRAPLSEYVPTEGFDYDSLGETILVWSAKSNTE